MTKDIIKDLVTRFQEAKALDEGGSFEVTVDEFAALFNHLAQVTAQRDRVTEEARQLKACLKQVL